MNNNILITVDRTLNEEELKQLDLEKLRYAYSCLKSLHETTNNRILVLEGQKNSLIEEKHLLEMQKVQWESEKIKQQLMIHQTISSLNKKSNEYLEENQQLQQEIKELKNRLEAD